VALVRKMTWNLRHPMGLRPPVYIQRRDHQITFLCMLQTRPMVLRSLQNMVSFIGLVRSCVFCKRDLWFVYSTTENTQERSHQLWLLCGKCPGTHFSVRKMIYTGILWVFDPRYIYKGVIIRVNTQEHSHQNVRCIHSDDHAFVYIPVVEDP